MQRSALDDVDELHEKPTEPSGRIDKEANEEEKSESDETSQLAR